MIRAGVIGVGYLGRFHAQKYQALEKTLPVKLTCVFDLSSARVAEISKELNVNGTSDLKEFLSQVDIVTIATSSGTHAEIALQCLEAGKHVNVEKPLALNTQDANRIVELAAKKNKLVSVGHSERFSPVFQELKRRKPQVLSATFSRLAPYAIRHAEVSVVMDLLVHDLDLVFDLIGEEPKGVEFQTGVQAAASKNEDWAQVWLEFSGNRKCIIECSRIQPALKREARILTSDRQYLVNFQNQELVESHFSATGELVSEKWDGGKADNLMQETQNFVKACLGQEDLVVTGQDGLRAVKWAEKIRG